ncbi:MAG: hypothetical protein KAV87_65115 [Desulfobacteraceae bacterium]|nr:hypothetical protein [Desulfobacteraceae bacterium]
MNKSLSTLKISLLVLAFVVMSSSELGVFAVGKQGEETLVEPKDRLVDLMAGAARDSAINIAYCAIPEKAHPSALENGIVPEMQSNYSKAVVALSLAKLSVTEKLRGDMDSVVFVRNVPAMVEGTFPNPFISEPGSRWVLFLESPFDSSHPDYGMIMEKYEASDAESFLSPRNLFTIYGRGYGAVCIVWPDTGEYKPGLVASPSFIEDLKLILERLENLSKKKDLEPEEQFLEKLKDEYGRLLYEKVFNID